MLKTRRFLSAISLSLGLASASFAAPVDFNTYTAETIEATATFAAPNWVVGDGGASVSETTNSHPVVFYGTENILNTIISGTMLAGSDDDLVGLALGFNPGDSVNANADWTLIDWKGVTQNFNFGGPSSDLTPASDCFIGLAVSRVEGVVNGDELWGHQTFDENGAGGVTELARAATLGSVSYSRTGAHQFSIVYQSDRLQVFVDGVKQFDLNGTFGNGRLGMYEHSQSPGATFSNFDISPAPSVFGDFNGDDLITIADFDILRTNFLEGTRYDQGDMNLDGKVDLQDFTDFRTAYASANPGSPLPSVPEPASFALVAISGAALLMVRARRRAS